MRSSMKPRFPAENSEKHSIYDYREHVNRNTWQIDLFVTTIEENGCAVTLGVA